MQAFFSGGVAWNDAKRQNEVWVHGHRDVASALRAKDIREVSGSFFMALNTNRVEIDPKNFDRYLKAYRVWIGCVHGASCTPEVRSRALDEMASLATTLPTVWKK